MEPNSSSVQGKQLPPLEDYLEEHGLAAALDALLGAVAATHSQPSSATLSSVFSALQQQQLVKIGFVPRRGVDGKGPTGRRFAVCTDLTNDGATILMLRLEALVRTLKLLMATGAKTLLLFYDAPNQANRNGAQRDDPLAALTLRLQRERMTVRVLSSPDELVHVDFSALTPTEVVALPNMCQFEKDAEPALFTQFIAPIIPFCEGYVCDALSHMYLQRSCTVTLPRAIGEAVLGVAALQETKSLGRILCGEAGEEEGRSNRVFIIGDEMVPYENAEEAAQCPTLRRLPLLPRLPPRARDNVTNLFDVVLVTGSVVPQLLPLLAPGSTAPAASSTQPPTEDSEALRSFVAVAKERHCEVVAASDMVAARISTATGKLKKKAATTGAGEPACPAGYVYYDMGCDTVERFKGIVASARSVCMMGCLGNVAREPNEGAAEVPNGTIQLLSAIPPTAHSVVCGEELCSVAKDPTLSAAHGPQNPLSSPSVKHLSLLRYDVFGTLLGGTALEPFSQLPLPTQKK